MCKGHPLVAAFDPMPVFDRPRRIEDVHTAGPGPEDVAMHVHLHTVGRASPPRGGASAVVQHPAPTEPAVGADRKGQPHEPLTIRVGHIEDALVR